MADRHCETCNAAPTAEKPLSQCGGCKRVAYCNRACQKAHWKTHKPACLAAVAADNEPDDYEDDLINAPDGFKDGQDNVVVGGRTYAPGTYLQYFVLPSPEYPNGHNELITLGPRAIIWLASLSEIERENYERAIINAARSSTPMQQDEFEPVATGQEPRGAGELENDINPTKFAEALKTLAARYHAARAPNPLSKKRQAAVYVRHNEQGDVIMRNDDDEEFVLPADGFQIWESAPSADFPEGFQEVLRFGADIIADMKYVTDEEKKWYKEKMGKAAIQQRFAGKSRAQKTAEKKHEQEQVNALTAAVKAKRASEKKTAEEGAAGAGSQSEAKDENYKAKEWQEIESTVADRYVCEVR